MSDYHFLRESGVELRRAEPMDADLIYEWENDPTVWHVSGTFAPYSLFQIEQSLIGDNDITSDKQIRLMISAEGYNNPCGCIDIFNYDPINQRAELGIYIEKKITQPRHCKTGSYNGGEIPFRNPAAASDFLLHSIEQHLQHQTVHQSGIQEMRHTQRLDKDSRRIH